MSRIVAIQPDLLGGPDVVGYAYEPEFFVWDWCGLLFPPSEEQVRQYKLQRADTLTPERSAELDRLADVARRSPLLDRAREHYPFLGSLVASPAVSEERQP